MTRDPRITKTKAQVRAELEAALKNLKSSCDQWELGQYHQSPAIAAHLRVLLHDYGTSVSLFKQMDWKSVPLFATHGVIATRGNVTVRHLCELQTEGAIDADGGSREAYATWVPHYYKSASSQWIKEARSPIRNSLPFDRWWNEPVMANREVSLSRAGVVLALANELGGNHSAPRIGPTTAALAAGELDYVVVPKVDIFGTPFKIVNTAREAIIRQIAFEVQETVARHFSSELDFEFFTPPLILQGARSGIMIHDDVDYMRGVLRQLIDSGESDSDMARDLDSKIRWRELAQRMRKSGLFA